MSGLVMVHSTENMWSSDGEADALGEVVRNLGPNFILVPQTPQLKALHTVIRDKNTVRSDFVFYADRLIRLVVEEGLNQLPFRECSVITPTGAQYDGCRFEKGNCGVSIVRSGEAMEKGLRSCCRSIRIGKILVESDETHNARVVYAKFPEDIAFRKALLMYPILSTGNTVIKAIEVLKEHNVPEENIILLNLFCTPVAAKSVLEAYPKLKLLSSEVHPFTPNNFGQRYFSVTLWNDWQKMSMSKAKNFELEMMQWNEVYDKLYKSEDREQIEWALRRIALWRARFPRIPTGMDVTERLYRALLKVEDIETEKTSGFVAASSSEIAAAHTALAFAIIRFVNLITDLNQKGAAQRPLHSAAREFNIPTWIVELRHDAAHSGVPSIYRLLDAARYCIQWLEEKYWAIEKPALEARLEALKECETVVNDEDDDDELEEVNPNEELLDKYVSIVDGRLKRGEDPGSSDAAFERLVESLTMAVSQNPDEFVDIVLREGYFLPTSEQAAACKDVNFKRWIPLLEAMYNASLYALPLLLERLLNPRSPTAFASKSSVSASGQRPAHTDRAVAQWFLFIVRHVARRKLAGERKKGSFSDGESESKLRPCVEEPEELNLPPDAECKIRTIDHDLPVEWNWLLKLAMHFPHSCTKYYLNVLCFLTHTSPEKTEKLKKALEAFLSSQPDDYEAAKDVDEHMDDEGGGWQLCSDKLPWKDYPLGNVPGKDLSTVSLEINWLPADV